MVMPDISILYLIFLSLTFVHGEVKHLSVKLDLTCPSRAYIHSASLQCIKCKDPKEVNEGCICAKHFLKLNGNMCSTKCSDYNLDTSINQYSCVACGDESINIDIRSNYDQIEKSCTCNNPQRLEKKSDLIPVSTRRLVEFYDSNSSLPIIKHCLQCPFGKAVIDKNIIISADFPFHTTVGVKYKPDPYTCASCPDPNMFFDKSYNCICADGFIMVGEKSIGSQACIQSLPSFSTDYTAVKFNPTSKSTGKYIDSIILSHFYIKAASDCEFSTTHTATENDVMRACQTLANLCVLHSYDEGSTPCIEFQSIVTQIQLSTFRTEEELWRVMPWLYYIDKSDIVTKYRGITMQMSLSDQTGYEHTLTFIAAKYTVDGNFLGFVNLVDELMYCGGNLKTEWFSFGKNRQIEYQCDLNDLLKVETFFYDLFITDTAMKKSHITNTGENFLYPVPVLSPNFVESGKLPNSNKNKNDDRYTRRFYLFDNLSGRTESGIQVIRYASKIILQTTIQSENSSRIYPPRIIIEYTDHEMSENEASSTIIFSAEYTMNTSNYWTYVKVIIGFVTAAMIIIWIWRIINWQNRNRKTDDLNSTIFITHSLMLLLHTFVLMFFPLLIGLCMYWFILSKYQGTSFIMLPSQHELDDTRNEYFIFEILIQALFLAQSVYICYIIYRQCHTDIFFIDWEQLKGQYSDVSMWRLIMIINEYNSLQPARKTCIEFNLFWILFFLVGLGFDENSSSQILLSKTSHEMSKNTALCIANNVIFWYLAYFIQWFFRFTIYERYIVEHRAQRMIDLATIAKISMFILNEKYHGYYIHCKSSYEFSDCSLEKICGFMKNEARELTPTRGLEDSGAYSDCQTFEIFFSSVFRNQINKVYEGLDKLSLRNFCKNIDDSKVSEKLFSSKTELDAFLISFIEQSPPPDRNGLKWVVRKPVQIERIFGIGPGEMRIPETKCILYPDERTAIKDYAFLETTFLGIEMTLLMHDILTYNFVDLVFGNPVISALITYITHLVRTFLRTYFGKHNLTKKAMINECFVK